MPSFKWQILFLVAAIMGPAPAFAATRGTVPDAAYQALNIALTEQQVIPRYRRLAHAAAGLDEAARRFCKMPDRDNRDTLTEHYQQAMDAWMSVQHVQFGAVDLFMRKHRLFFGPDHRGYVAEQLDELLAGRDPKILDPQFFGNASVAIQGLPALEQLLFEDPASRERPANSADKTYRCALMMAITGNLETMAAGILHDWQMGDHPFANMVASPGENNAYYQTAQQVTLDFFKSLHGGLQLIGDIKLKPVLGDSQESARPQRAESWRSQRSLRNIVVNLEALAALYLGEGGTGFTDLVQAYGNDPKLDPLLRKAFAMTLDTARSIHQPLTVAVKDAVVRPRVEKLNIQVMALKQIVKTRLASTLDLAVGFNALDGD